MNYSAITVTILHLIALAFFVHGFLLVRIHLTDKSTSIPGDIRGNPSAPPPFSRLVWITIDALRYDFAVSDGRYTCTPDTTYCHQGHMPFLSTLIQHTSHDIVTSARFVADPPTTTTQRLKALTTGSLPTFFDISSSFNASPLTEDNLIDQLAAKRRTNSNNNMGRLAFVGDTTWTQLFPSQWSHSSLPLPCFNVLDLHTVDDGIAHRLDELMYNNNNNSSTIAEDWDVLVLHYLGVDHCGHAHGVSSEIMATKLQQMDQEMEKLIIHLSQNDDNNNNNKEERTLVIIGGDHGQTLGGDHGGGGPEEVDSLFLAIDIQGLKPHLPRLVKTKNILKSRGGLFKGAEETSFSRLGVEDGGKLAQIDVVPSLAALMGVPIPFGSLGVISPELLHIGSKYWKEEEGGGGEGGGGDRYDDVLAHAVRVNAQQVYGYLKSYTTQSRSLASSFFTSIDDAYQKLPTLEACMNNNSNGNNNTSSVLCTELSLRFLKETVAMARDEWTQFGDISMLTGLVILAITVLIQAMRIIGNTKGNVSSMFDFSIIVPSLAAAGFVMLGIFSFFYLLTEGTMVTGVLIALTIMLGLSTIVVTTTNSSSSTRSSKRSTKTRSSSKQHSSSSSMYTDTGGGSHLYTMYTVSIIILCAVLIASLGVKHHSGHAMWQKLHAPQDDPLIVLQQEETGDVVVQPWFLQSGGKFQQLIWDVYNSNNYARSVAVFVLSSCAFTSAIEVVPCLLLGVLVMKQVVGVQGQGKKTYVATAKGKKTTHNTTYINSIQSLWMLYAGCVLLAVYKAITNQAFLDKQCCADNVTIADLITKAIGSDTISGMVDDNSGSALRAIIDVPLKLLLPWALYTICILQFSTMIIVHVVSKKSQGGMVAVLSALLLLVMPLLSDQEFSTFIIVLIAIELYYLDRLISSLPLLGSTATIATKRGLVRGVVVVLVQMQVFFATGHLCEFAGLRYTAAFVGLGDYHLRTGVFLMSLDTFGGMTVVGLVGLRGRGLGSGDDDDDNDDDDDDRNAVKVFGCIRGAMALVAMISAAVQKRHLYVWALFAPRFVFEACFLLLGDAIAIVVGW